MVQAVQTGEYPAGVDRLRKLERDIQSNPKSRQETSYVAYRIIDAEYNLELSNVKKDSEYEKIQEAHDEKLVAFVDAYPTSADSVMP